jgi:glutamate N-acetyltransferase / amino-acid N-acetyltransferase
LKKLLTEALPLSFNRITVDGDTSTNDTILLLASGAAGNPLIKGGEPAAAHLGDMATRVLADLAGQVVADGEGARTVFRVAVEGAATAKDALNAARTVALSPLVKTAMAGADVNWGRILCALGYSGAKFDPERVEIAYGEQPVAREGQGLGEAAEAAAREIILSGKFTLHIKLNAGSHADYYDTCDFTEDYIRINASYRS